MRTAELSMRGGEFCALVGSMKGFVCEKLREETRLDRDGRNGEFIPGRCVVWGLCDKASKGERLARLIRL